MTCLAAQKSCLINEVLHTPLFPTAKALHICFQSPSLAGVTAGLYVWHDFTGEGFVSITQTWGRDAQPQPSPALSPDRLGNVISMSQQQRKKQSLFLTDPITFICSASTHPLPKILLKTEPTAKLCHQCVPSRAFAACSPQRCSGICPSPALPSLHQQHQQSPGSSPLCWPRAASSSPSFPLLDI